MGLEIRSFAIDPIKRHTASRAKVSAESPLPRIPLKTNVFVMFAQFGDFFVENSANISQSGIFIKSDRPRPPGSVFMFATWLGEEFRLVCGVAEVVWVRKEAEGPERPTGMGVRYLKTDRSSQEMIGRVVDGRLRRGGLDQRSAERPAFSDIYDTREIQALDRESPE